MNSTTCMVARPSDYVRRGSTAAMPRSQDSQFTDRSPQSRSREHLDRRLSRRQFLIGLMFTSAGAIVPGRLDWFAQPASARTSPAQTDTPCAEPMQRVLDLAVTA